MTDAEIVAALRAIRPAMLYAMGIVRDETGRIYRREIEVLALLGPWTATEQERVNELLTVDEFSRDEDSEELSRDDDSDEYTDED